MEDGVFLRINKNAMPMALLVVFMFFAVFTPDLISFSMRYLIVIVSIFGISWRVARTGELEFDRSFLSIVAGFIPFLVYLLISQVIRIVFDRGNTGVYLGTTAHTLLALGGAFIICLFVIQACKNNGITFEGFIKIILFVMILQFICVVLALLVPGIRNAFNSLIARNSYSKELAELAKVSMSGRTDRAYGLSNNLFDSFGYITAMLIVLLFAAGIDRKDGRLTMLSIVFILMPLVNARTGIVLVALGLVIVGVLYFDLKSVVKMVLIAALTIIGLVLIINRLPDEMVKWLASGIQETKTLLNDSEKTGVYSELLGVDIVLPSNLILGAGGSPSSFGYGGIDNGYINCLWYYGIIGSLMLFIGYINLFRITFLSSRNKLYKTIALAFGAIFFVYLFKNYSIDNFGGNVVVFIIPALTVALSSCETVEGSSIGEVCDNG